VKLENEKAQLQLKNKIAEVSFYYLKFIKNIFFNIYKIQKVAKKLKDFLIASKHFQSLKFWVYKTYLVVSNLYYN